MNTYQHRFTRIDLTIRLCRTDHGANQSAVEVGFLAHRLADFELNLGADHPITQAALGGLDPETAARAMLGVDEPFYGVLFDSLTTTAPARTASSTAASWNSAAETTP